MQYAHHNNINQGVPQIEEYDDGTEGMHTPRTL